MDYPVKKKNNEVSAGQQDSVESLRPSAHNTNTPFISFRYSYKSVSCFGGKTYVKSRKERFVNGQFESEEFEGMADGDMYSDMMLDFQKNFFNHLLSFFRPFSFFLPFSSRDRK